MAEESQDQPKDQKLTIVFRRSPDYRIFHGNLWQGGPTPGGDGILLNLCIDHLALPSYVVHEITDGRVDISNPTESVSAGQVEREVLCGILLSKNEAQQLQGFLAQFLDKLGD